MYINHEVIKHNHIDTNNSEDVFYDCEPYTLWPGHNDDEHAAVDDIINQPQTALAEDLKIALTNLLKIAVSHEASRFSMNMGLDIPQAVFNTAWCLYNAITARQSISTVLEAGLPLCINAILSHSQFLVSVSVYVRDYIEEQLGPSLTGALDIGADNILTHNSYLFFGALALASKYYCDGGNERQPQRRCLNLPVAIARLFNKACQYWQGLCVASGVHQRQPTDEGGRMLLNPTEKTQQALGRNLARQWARQSHYNQLRAERAAEQFYGISAKTGSAASRARVEINAQPRPRIPPVRCPRLSVARDTGEVTDCLPGTRAPHLLTITPSFSRGLAGFSLPRLSLLPMTAAAPILDATPAKQIITALAPERDTPAHKSDILINRHLQQAFPTITRIVTAWLNQEIKTRYLLDIKTEECWVLYFDRPYPDREPTYGRSQIAVITQSMPLTEYVINNFFSKECQDLNSVDKYQGIYFTERPEPMLRHHSQAAIKPSQIIELLNNMDIASRYLTALDVYWRENKPYHVIANIINILTHLSIEQTSLADSVVAIILHALGLEKNDQLRVRVKLFDINGYPATDMVVFSMTGENMLILYQPRGVRHFWVFNGINDLRNWVIEQCRNETQRIDIASHFTLQDRVDGMSLFGFYSWGVDRWLAHAGAYPDRIMTLNESLSEPCHLALGNRQQARSLSDAAKLGYASHQGLWTLAATALDISANLFAMPLVPFVPLAAQTNKTDGVAKNFLRMAQYAGDQGDTVKRALSILASVLSEIMPYDEKGAIQPALSLNFTLAEYFHIVHTDIALWKTMPEATSGEKRLVKRLSVYPLGYRRVLQTHQHGTTDNHFTLSLMTKDGLRRDDIIAIRMYKAALPIRFNSRLQLFEVYDIDHISKAGYPVYMFVTNNITHWQFGRVTDTRSNVVGESEVIMADYAFVSVRLFDLIMENIDNLCAKVKSLTPINSQGLAQDALGHSYLKVGIHYIKIEIDAERNHYYLGDRDACYLLIIYDGKLKKFTLYLTPEQKLSALYNQLAAHENDQFKSTNISLSYRSGYRGANEQEYFSAMVADNIILDAGVKEIICYGLLPHEIVTHPEATVLASRLKNVMSACRHIIMDMMNTSECVRQAFLMDTIYTLIRVKNPDKDIFRAKNIIRFNELLEKMLDIIEQHIADKFSRIWLARFHQSETIVMTVHGDPLKRLWVSAGDGDNESASPSQWYRARFCRYGCSELPPAQNIAILDRVNLINGTHAGRNYAAQYQHENFKSIINRLWAGEMTEGEVNFLISLPEVTAVKNYLLMTDRELARKLFRKKATVRMAMIFRNADLFCELLAHLHRGMNNGHPQIRHHQDPWLMSLLFAVAFHATGPATSAPARV
ncbi:dermonecrotic toxin domain-containing protein [Sodalis sp. RH24]|uniref:dermonecrotic toxin domain-containing protein n=1 Tax=unclassified Sodalis (in: enterobacteria) TaxID=2636512 RepID=UPI0039B38D1A